MTRLLLSVVLASACLSTATSQVASAQSQTQKFNLTCNVKWEMLPIVQNGEIKSQGRTGFQMEEFSIDLESMTYVKRDSQGVWEPRKIVEVTEQQIVLTNEFKDKDYVNFVEEYFSRQAGTYHYARRAMDIMKPYGLPRIVTTSGTDKSGQCVKSDFAPFVSEPKF